VFVEATIAMEIAATIVVVILLCSLILCEIANECGRSANNLQSKLPPQLCSHCCRGSLKDLDIANETAVADWFLKPCE